MRAATQRPRGPAHPAAPEPPRPPLGRFADRAPRPPQVPRLRLRDHQRGGGAGRHPGHGRPGRELACRRRDDAPARCCSNAWHCALAPARASPRRPCSAPPAQFMGRSVRVNEATPQGERPARGGFGGGGGRGGYGGGYGGRQLLPLLHRAPRLGLPASCARVACATPHIASRPATPPPRPALTASPCARRRRRRWRLRRRLRWWRIRRRRLRRRPRRLRWRLRRLLSAPPRGARRGAHSTRCPSSSCWL